MNNYRLDGLCSSALALRYFGGQYKFTFSFTTEERAGEDSFKTNAERDIARLAEGDFGERTLLLLGLRCTHDLFRGVRQIAQTAEKVIWVDHRPELMNQAGIIQEYKNIEVGCTNYRFCTSMVFQQLFFDEEDLVTKLLSCLAQISVNPGCRVETIEGCSEGQLARLSKALQELITPEDGEDNQLIVFALALWLASDLEYWVNPDLTLTNEFLAHFQRKEPVREKPEHQEGNLPF